jgi:hypothetical protein
MKLKATWHWVRDCSVVNNPLVEPGPALLYVGHPSTSGSVDGDQIFSLFFVGELLSRDSDGYVNEYTIGSGDEASLSLGTLFWGTWRGVGGSFTGDFLGKV